MWELRTPVAAGLGRSRPSETSNFAQAVGVAAVMVVFAVVVAAAVAAFDLFWEILARFAPGSVIPCGSLVSHRSGTWVPGILLKD